MKELAVYICLKCNHKWTQKPQQVYCPKCNHPYVEWENFIKWREDNMKYPYN